MSFRRFAAAEAAAVVAFTLSSTSIVGAANVRSVTVFAEGAAVNARAPDSIALTNDSIWVSYANGADSTGLSGSSTVVEYTFSGQIRRTFSIAGSVDGLKVDPQTGLVWAMQNQDGKFDTHFDRSPQRNRAGLALPVCGQVLDTRIR